MGDDEALLRELLETFQIEALDHIGALSTLVIALEKEPEPAERKQLAESIFRRMHTLKGAAHAVNLSEIAGTCQRLESLLADLKRGDISLDLGLFDLLHAEIDSLAARISARSELGAAETNRERKRSNLPPLPASGATENTENTEADRGAARPAPARGARPAAAPPRKEAAPSTAPAVPVPEGRQSNPDQGLAADTVRVSTRVLESLLLQAEELVLAKLAASVLQEELAAAAAELDGHRAVRARAGELAQKALKDPTAHGTALAHLVQDLCDRERGSEIRLHTLEKRAERNFWSLRGMVDPLLEEMKKLNLLPFATLTGPFAKVVRDLTRELGKKAELDCSGLALDIDRRILAELKEPLLHIIRNVVDHGLETPAERVRAGKPEQGRIGIELRLREANRAELLIVDDGRGIDPGQVKATALRLELLTPEAAQGIGDHEALQLIFESGFSTSPIITSLSGRGLGLAIVREALERLGGHVAVTSRAGEGTEFRLELPLSFAMIRGVQVEVGGRDCILPASNVEVTARLPRDQIKRVENRDTVLLNGEVVALVSLAQVLELGDAGQSDPDGFQQVVLLRAADKRIAFAVDQVVGVQEVLVKPLGAQLSRVRNVAGATVLGNGCVVPVLNINDLVRSALLTSGQGPRALGPASPTRPRRLSVLVAEDSITSRTLLKNILESSGFQVATAVDGSDALSQLKTGSFDIVVSDVEMPRLDGFQLTAAIRAESRWADLPVILVTGLESRADRERGIEVGANAYVVKSSFDQSSLIEVIQKLT